MTIIGFTARALLPATTAVLLLTVLPPGAGAADVHFSHAAFDTVLGRHLASGRVDYGALLEERGPLDRYLAAVAAADPRDWPRAEQFAFWINAYNARTIAGVLDHPGIASVLDVGRILGIPTMAFFRKKAMTGGRNLSLGSIEHDILRERFGDPRVHFVLNCASTSCPELPSRPLTGATLDSALTAATARFLADPARNRIAPPDTLVVSEIFKWYRKDFEAASGSVTSFIESHMRGRVDFAEEVRVQYMKYDWSLNGSW